MTHQEILEKAISKAIEGGWTWPFGDDYFKPQLDIYGDSLDNLYVWNHGQYEDLDTVRWQEIIFNQDFEKALWNAPKMLDMDFTKPSFETRDGLSEWQYHLQQMVIAPDPLKYLGDNI